MYQAWGTALGTALAGFTVATTTAAGIEAVGTAIVSGDPANVVNAAQHSVANIASAGISAVDTTINLNVALARQAFAVRMRGDRRRVRVGVDIAGAPLLGEGYLGTIPGHFGPRRAHGFFCDNAHWFKRRL